MSMWTTHVGQFFNSHPAVLWAAVVALYSAIALYAMGGLTGRKSRQTSSEVR